MAHESFWRQWRRCALQVDHLNQQVEHRTEHRHHGENLWVAFAVLNDAVTVTTTHGQWHIDAGHCCVIPPGIPWQRTSSPQTEIIIAWFQIFFPPGWSNPLQECSLPAVMAPVDNAYLLQALRYFSDAPAKGAEQALASQYFHLWLTQSLHQAEHIHATYAGWLDAAPAWLRAVIAELIPRQNEHQWTVSGFARLAGVTPNWLADICRSKLGATPRAIMQHERVVFAVELLRSKRVDSVEEVSERLLYRTPRVLWRQCVQETGHPPSWWLRH